MYGVPRRTSMRFDEFLEKLREVLTEYERDVGRKAETVRELEEYLAGRKFRTSGRRHLRSLKGFNF